LKRHRANCLKVLASVKKAGGDKIGGVKNDDGDTDLRDNVEGDNEGDNGEQNGFEDDEKIESEE